MACTSISLYELCDIYIHVYDDVEPMICAVSYFIILEKKKKYKNIFLTPSETMTENTESFDDTRQANALKEGMVIVTDESTKEYVKITKRDKVKNGKHGAAKIMITGKNVRTGNKAEVTYTGGTIVSIVSPIKTTYVLSDLDDEEDCLYAEPFVSSGHAEIQTLHLNQIDKNGVELIRNTYKEINNDKESIVFITMAYPGLILVDSVKAVSKQSIQARWAAPAG